MPYKSEPELLVLHALRLKGFAEPPAVAEATAVDEAEWSPSGSPPSTSGSW